jgi:hypothetical protein
VIQIPKTALTTKAIKVQFSDFSRTKRKRSFLQRKRERVFDLLLQVGRPTQSGRSELEVRRGGFACHGVPAIATDRDGRKKFLLEKLTWKEEEAEPW